MKLCEVCGKREGTDTDHALFPSPKWSNKHSAEKKAWLNDGYNLRLACADCNRWTRAADTYESRLKHVKKWMEREPDGFVGWLYSYPGNHRPGSRMAEIRKMVQDIKKTQA